MPRALRQAQTSALPAGELAILTGGDRGIFAARAATLTETQANRMASLGRGLLSVTLDLAAAFRLGIQPMAGTQLPDDGSPVYLASIEVADCPGSGISAADRALTIRTAADPNARAGAVVMPGHIMPLLIRRPAGTTLPEIAAAMLPHEAVAWCDILGEDGDLATAAYCRELGFRHDIAVY
ncbi:MAG: 3,4-dihydroxy-2-butanone-4-phosphate synthase [Alphaproteobacteria bacterium]|nr:3,4-dihydroxy-2-butanone-4-phosphate synthase [Alphaproteobacteria bacterium]